LPTRAGWRRLATGSSSAGRRPSCSPAYRRSVDAAYEVNRALCAGGDARGSIAAASLHAGPMLASARMRQGLCSLRATPDIRGRIPLTSADGPSPRRESVGRSGTGAPYSAALRVVGAANCRRCRPPARRTSAPPPEPEQIQPPHRCPRGGTPSVGRRMPPWHRRSRWGPRSTGASAPARFPGAARPGRHEPAEPVLATLGAGQRRAGSGGTAIRGAAGCRRISHDGRDPRRGKTQEERPPSMPDAHGQ
jgi:hypothetical protein